MPTAVLDRLLMTQWGKVFIFWVFIGLCAIVSCLGWYCFELTQQLVKCKEEQTGTERWFSSERERLSLQYFEQYKSLLERLNALETKKKR